MPVIIAAMSATDFVKLLREKNLGVEAAGDAIGKSHRTMWRYVSGDSPVPLDTVMAIKSLKKRAHPPTAGRPAGRRA